MGEHELKIITATFPVQRSKDWPMYHIKKRLPLFITSFMVLSLYGCSSSDSDNINSSAKMKQNSISSTQKCISFDTKGQHKEAFPYCKIAAEMGNSFAQTLVGSMYFRGEGIAQSYEQAAFWFQKVAHDGDVNAQALIGSLYFEGKGVSQNNTQATFWFQKAARQVSLHPMTLVGAMYFEGQWVNQDYMQAAHWYQLAAEQGDDNAQFRLGTMYHEGQGILQNYEQAAYWYQKSAEQGNSNAQAFLGGMYFEGRGMIKDYKQAYAWLSVAAKHNEEAIKSRDSVAAQLSPEDLFEAQTLATEYLKKYNIKL